MQSSHSSHPNMPPTTLYPRRIEPPFHKSTSQPVSSLSSLMHPHFSHSSLGRDPYEQHETFDQASMAVPSGHIRLNSPPPSHETSWPPGSGSNTPSSHEASWPPGSKAPHTHETSWPPGSKATEAKAISGGKWEASWSLWLINEVRDEIAAGNGKNGGISVEAWTQVAKKFNTKFGVEEGKPRLKNHIQVLKKTCKALEKIINTSGGPGVDMVMGQVTANKEWWDTWIKKEGNVKAIPIRNNGGFLLYQAVLTILPQNNNQANDHFAFGTQSQFTSASLGYSGSVRMDRDEDSGDNSVVDNLDAQEMSARVGRTASASNMEAEVVSEDENLICLGGGRTLQLKGSNKKKALTK